MNCSICHAEAERIPCHPPPPRTRPEPIRDPTFQQVLVMLDLELHLAVDLQVRLSLVAPSWVIF